MKPPSKMKGQLLFSTGLLNNDLEGDDYDIQHVEEELLYTQLVQEYYAEILSVKPDAHVPNRFWVRASNQPSKSRKVFID